MYYDKEKVNNDLEYGIDDPGDCITDLYEFINTVFENKDNPKELEILKNQWEG